MCWSSGRRIEQMSDPYKRKEIEIMNEELKKIADAVRQIAIETGKPEMVIVSALSDYGIITLQQDMALHDHFE